MNRRSFLKASAGALALVSAGQVSYAATGVSAKKPRRIRFHLGMAGYTYNKFTIDQTLAELEQFGVHHLCVKDFHLPIQSTEAEIGAFRKKCADHGVTPYGVGPIYMQTEDEAKRAFAYAAALGVPVVVGVPWKPDANGSTKWNQRRQSPELCAKVAELCAQYDLKFAIHNHGRNPQTGSPALFGAPADVWEIVKDLDKRMGFCIDVAYTFADGFDPAEVIRSYAGRIFDCHFRNISDPKNGSAGVNSSDGVIDYLPIVRALADIGYEGACGIELANAFPKMPAWIPLSIGYFKGLMDAVDAAMPREA
ncbi:MAG: sugar phosphate isomerase/epimerase [Kiritimatiellae bacterium]|nr:sugar phosphate isomerase/epimerase [Kiritimatiellia bacterium]